MYICEHNNYVAIYMCNILIMGHFCFVFVILVLALHHEAGCYISTSGVCCTGGSPRAKSEAFAPPPSTSDGQSIYVVLYSVLNKKKGLPSKKFELTFSLDGIFVPTPRPFRGLLKMSIVDTSLFKNNSTCFIYHQSTSYVIEY